MPTPDDASHRPGEPHLHDRFGDQLGEQVAERLVRRPAAVVPLP